MHCLVHFKMSLRKFCWCGEKLTAKNCMDHMNCDENLDENEDYLSADISTDKLKSKGKTKQKFQKVRFEEPAKTKMKTKSKSKEIQQEPCNEDAGRVKKEVPKTGQKVLVEEEDTPAPEDMAVAFTTGGETTTAKRIKEKKNRSMQDSFQPAKASEHQGKVIMKDSNAPKAGGKSSSNTKEGNKKFRCNSCDYSSQWSSNLTKHKRVCKKSKEAHHKAQEERLQECEQMIKSLQTENLALMNQIVRLSAKFESIM